MKALENAADIYSVLYVTTDVSAQDLAIQSFYLHTATFEDPLVKCIGVNAIKANFNALRIFTQISHAIHSSSAKTNSDGTETVTVDATVTFNVWLLTFRLRQISVFGVREDGRCFRHEDIWSLRHLLENFWGFAYVYGILRIVLGKVVTKSTAITEIRK